MPDQNQKPYLPEQSPENVQSDELSKEQSFSVPEKQSGIPESVSEKGTTEVPVQVQVPPTQQQMPAAQTPVSDGSTVPASGSNQVILDETNAEDVDIIEKPWVKKAEEIIKKDKDKPYFEEEDHEDLQIDYLKKRFGKEIRKSEEEGK